MSGQDSEVAHIQTFFTGVDGSGNYTADYPNAATNKAPDGSVIPNWYYPSRAERPLALAMGM